MGEFNEAYSEAQRIYAAPRMTAGKELINNLRNLDTTVAATIDGVCVCLDQAG